MPLAIKTTALAAALCLVGATGPFSPVLALAHGGAEDTGAKPGFAAFGAHPADQDRAIVAPQTAPPPATTQAAPATNVDNSADAGPVDIDEDAGDADAAPAYATLDAAVAAQAMPGAMDADLRCLASAIYFESKGEPLAGQLAVGHVIINRTRSGRFASTICSVVTQPGQFSFVHGGRIPTMNLSSRAYRDAVAVAQLALANQWRSVAPDALFFHARQVSPGWRQSRVATIGNHIFYR